MRLLIACLLILSALGLIVLAVTGSRTKPAKKAVVREPTQVVLVAAAEAGAGLPLIEAKVSAKRIAASGAPVDAVNGSLRSSPRFKDALLRQDVAAGHILRSTDLLFAGDRGYLASSLLPGTRAVTVAVDAVTGLAGLVSPGDRVDLILIQSAASSDGAGQEVVAEHILNNVRVLAIDERLVRASQSTKPSAPPKTVTLQVSPQEALRVTVAQQLGRIALNIRPPEAAAPAEIAQASPLYGREVAKGRLVREVRPRTGTAARSPRAMTVIEGGDVKSVLLP